MQTIQALFAIFGVHDTKPFAFQDRLNQAALRGIVITNKDRLGHVSCTSS